MSIHVDFYKALSPEKLEEYALAAGFGNSYPVDLKEFDKFLNGARRVLEVGCGTGRLGLHLVKRFDYVGIDENETYLKVFQDRLRKQGTENPERHAARASFSEFDDSRFDVVLFAWSVIMDFDDEEQVAALKRARALLNDGGVVLLDNPAPGAARNVLAGYEPVEFHYYDWKDRFGKLGYARHEVRYYETLTGRRREIVVLRK